MPKYLKRLTLIAICVAALLCVLAVGANAYTYPTMPSNWEDVQVTVGDVTMPLERYPSGAYYDPEKRYMTLEEQKDYGITLSGALDLRGWECVSFARYVYSALFYKYPQNATIDTGLAYEYRESYAYTNMILSVLGTKTLSAGYSASTLKTLITACRPGAVMRVGGHSLVIMAIYDDGVLVYDANFSSSNTVSVRMYTWASFVSSLGSRGIAALQMPTYYPGYSYSIGDNNNSYPLDTTTAGEYVVYNCTTLNVRALPTTASSAVGSISVGTTLEVLGTYGNWAKIMYQSKGRWVYLDYLQIKQQEVAVTFDPNGGTASFTSRIYVAGETFGTLPTAQKTDRVLLGWVNGSNTYTADSRVPSVETLILKAQWCVLGYRDVLEDSWYATYVEQAYGLGLISADTQFNPTSHALRSQMVTILGREYERETGTQITASGVTQFSDVPADSFYAKYVAWGFETGIVKGTGETTFSPNGNVTREQIAEFLYRFAVYTHVAVRTEADETFLSQFEDGGAVSGYARAAVCWAVESGILQGDNTGNLNPQTAAARSEMITMFTRYIAHAEEVKSTKILVSFDPNGGTVSPLTQSYFIGTAFGTLPTPVKAYRTFLGWYEGDTAYTAETIVPLERVTLTAKWSVLGYSDVNEGDWYVPYLEYCSDYGLLTAGSTFAPSAKTTRSEVVTMLGRAYEWQTETDIQPSSTTVFTDISLSAEYAKYVIWGNEAGLVMGVSATQFQPDAETTRAQIAMFLYRLAVYTGQVSSGEADLTVLEEFADGESVPEIFQQAMSWAVEAGIFAGDDQQRLNPFASATHAELVTVMVRYLRYTLK